MPTVLLNAAVALPVAGPGGPAEPIGPPPSEGAFASALHEAGLVGGDTAQVLRPMTVAPDQALPPLPAAPDQALPPLPAAPDQTLPALPAAPGQPLPVLPGSGGSAALSTETVGPSPPLARPALADLVAPAAALPSGWPPPGLAALFPAPLLPLVAGRGSSPLPNAAASGQTEAQPSVLVAALRLPLARERSEEALLLLPERPGAGPGEVESLPWSPASTSGLPRLDLAAAFPTPLPLQDRRFAESLGGRLQWLADQGGGEVRLRLSPEGLGPVEIRLQLDGDRVDLAMHASLAETRQALEQALPKLREMLAQGGLQLGQADVGQQPAHDRKPDTSEASFGEGLASTAAAVLIPASASPPRRGEGLLDLYA